MSRRYVVATGDCRGARGETGVHHYPRGGTMRIIVRGAVVAAAATMAIGMGGTAFAAAPDGSFQLKGTNSHGNCVGVESSQITQNGQFVSGQPNDFDID